jgi:Domain of unknown function (DUF4864)
MPASIKRLPRLLPVLAWRTIVRLELVAPCVACTIAGLNVTGAQPWQLRDQAPPPHLSAATELTRADQAAMRLLIEEQIAAMRADDWPGAFALASPDLQEQYGTSTAFGKDVTEHYAPLPHVLGVEFIDIVSFREFPTYRVTLTDGNGSTTTAYYLVRRLDDGSLRIAGCVLVRGPSS